MGKICFGWADGLGLDISLDVIYFHIDLSISLISSFSNFLTSSRLVRYFRLTAPAAVLGHLGAISLKNLTKRKEVRKLEKELIRLYRNRQI